MATPTWYDVLGVPHDASPDEIKSAWRVATDKFEPGTGSSSQFRMFNEAADVLLDPASRAEYDASLAGEQPVDLAKTPAAETAPDAPTPQQDIPEPDEHVAAESLPTEPSPEPSSEPSPEPGPEPRRASRRAGLLALVLAVLTIAALVLAGYFGLKVRNDAAVDDARDEAPATAETAAKALLAYDYRHLPADRKRASAYLTPAFRTKYLKNFSLLEKQKDGSPGAAVQTKTIVTSSVLGSGVMDAEDRVVRVLVFVNQVSKKPGKDPQIFQNRVAMTMQKHGNKWLVSDLKSY